MKKLMLFIIGLLVVSIVVNILMINVINNTSHENRELQKYVKDFRHEAEIRGRDIPNRQVIILFGKLAPRVIGNDSYIRKSVTIKRSPMFLNSKIIVDIDWYRNSDSLQREKTLFHELAHLYLSKYNSIKHDNRYIYRDRQLIALSMMNRTNAEYYDQARNYYLNELFK